MKKITIKHFRELTQFLEEEGIAFINNGNGTITFEYKDEAHLFVIGYDYGLYLADINYHNQI